MKYGIYCGRCGQQSDGQSQFCTNCGARLSASSAAPAMPPPVYGEREDRQIVRTSISAAAVWSLVTSLIGLGPVAIILGHIARRRIRMADGNLTGSGIASAGLVLGYISTAVSLLLAAIMISANNSAVSRAKMATTQAEMHVIKAALIMFKMEFGTFPQGDNRQVVRVLLGDNPRNMDFIDISPDKISAAGEMCDAWKIPYRFQFNGTKPSVSSAGPDRSWNTADDIESR